MATRGPQLQFRVARRSQPDHPAIVGLFDVETGHRLRVAAIEAFRQPEKRGQHPDAPPIRPSQFAVALVRFSRRGLAVIARDERHDFDLVGIEATQVAVLDEVVRMFVMALVADVQSDVVQQRGIFEPLALADAEPVGVSRGVEQRDRQLRDLTGMVGAITAPLAKLESKLIGDLDGPFRLKDKLKDAGNEYDYIFIDTPPTLGMITVNALVASTHVLVPIQSSYFALEGTDDLLETIEKVRQRPNPALRILGVVITMHDKRTALARDIREQIQKVFGQKVFRTVISKSVRLEESPAYKESIFTFAPDSTGATDYYSLCEEVIERGEARTA